MKSCPTCNRTYPDDTMAFCLVDGSILSAPYDPQATIRASAPVSTERPTEVLVSSDLRSAPALDKTLTAPPLVFKPAPSEIVGQGDAGPTPQTQLHPLRRWLIGTAFASFLGVLCLFTYSYILLGQRTGLSGMSLVSEAAPLLLVGAVIGTIHGLIIEAVLMMLSGFLVDELRAVLAGVIVSIAVVLIYRWLIWSYNIEFGPPYGDMVIRLEHLFVAVLYGLFLGIILGILFHTDRKAT